MDRRHRLTSSRDFARAMRSGKRASSGPISVTVLLTGDDRPARVGISARNAAGAVPRNRAKRLLREAVRPRLAALPVGADIVLSAKPQVSGKSFHIVEEALVGALQKVGIAC